MTATSDQYGYRYEFASAVDDRGIQLATCDRLQQWEEKSAVVSEDGPFLRSQLVYPRPTARMLSALSGVVRTHYFDARPPQFDPIATASKNIVRFEGFSGCCGVYVRLDMDSTALQAEEMRFGTTSVDFNLEMIQHLDRIARSSDVALDISPQSVSLEHSGKRVVEKKVALPQRWVKGLCEGAVRSASLSIATAAGPPLFARFDFGGRVKSLGLVESDSAAGA